MRKAPIPDLFLGSIYEMKPETLTERGIRLLFLDLDNTLVPYGRAGPDEKLRVFIASLKAADVEPFILSNNRGARPKMFGEKLGLSYARGAKKPSTRVLASVMESRGVLPENAAILGDQIFTDVLCGKRAGLFTIAVRPVSLINPWYLMRYGLEFPFRAAAKNKGEEYVKHS